MPCSHVDTGLLYPPSLDLTVLTLNVVTCTTEECQVGRLISSLSSQVNTGLAVPAFP